jgi:hypothetical protein
MHETAKKANAFVDSDFRWIVSQIPFDFHHASIDIKRTTGAINTPQTPHFGT